MAGRPKMMARRVWNLKIQFEELISQFNGLCVFIATHAHLCGMAHPYRLGVL